MMEVINLFHLPKFVLRAMAFARLDHVIYRVPNIEAAHQSLQEMGFAEAWPIGPFWPSALTSGIALGGINLELFQPLENPPAEGYIDTLVFEPTSLESVAQAIPVRRFEKIEPNPDLLRLRGFSEEESQTPQAICTNLFPTEPAPLDFFVCEYVPFLRHRLAPDRFPKPHGDIVSIAIPAEDPRAAQEFLIRMAYEGVPLRFETSETWKFEFVDGFTLSL